MTTEKIDLKKALKYLYNPPAKSVVEVDVPAMNFLMIDGRGNPNTALETTPGDASAQARAREQAVQRKRLRLRMQGVIDQMQAGVARIDELGVTLREIETGLVDFPALVSGRQVWLCWRLGEGDVEWWHELSDGFGGRRPLADLA